MRTEAMIDALKKAVRDRLPCEECPFECKGGNCLLIAIAKRLEVLQRNAARAQRLMREAVNDLKDADAIECSHCQHYDRAIDECNEDVDCQSCNNDSCRCKSCIDMCNWEWRGFAGEGK